MKIEFVIVDIDGTVADLRHRLHFIQGEKKDWDAFYARVSGDFPIESTLSVINFNGSFRGSVSICYW